MLFNRKAGGGVIPHKTDRPREKLERSGVSSLKDEELLAILLSTGTAGKNVFSLAKELLKKYKGKELLKVSLKELKSKKGIGLAKACTLLSAFELTQRLLEDHSPWIPTMESPRDVLVQVQEIRSRKKENFLVLYLNARNQLLHKEFVSIGTLNSTLVHPREVFAPAIAHAAAGIILAHNHPSGDCQPSEEDLALTKRLIAAGELLGIEVLDHMIVSPTAYLSMKEKSLL